MWGSKCETNMGVSLSRKVIHRDHSIGQMTLCDQWYVGTKVEDKCGDVTV